tara:strand:+ start:714 stop:1586 length:873 start_codon:yes stop_codon:yes gene_type:complete
MEIRNIQKTGDMHYVYLPTSWCREHKISSKSKVSIDNTGDGALTISPGLVEKKPKHLIFNISEDQEDVIHKLVVASYINPSASFEINMDKEMDFTKLLNQKRLISLESVEIDKKQITSQGSVTVSDPESLLKTMVKKIKNMIIVMGKSYDKELIERYEYEIDRSKMLIDKSVIGSLTFGKTTKLKNIDLYYISLISKDLERMVDRLICLDEGNKKFLDEIIVPIEILHDVVHNISSLSQKTAIEFAKAVSSIKKIEVKNVKTNDMSRMVNNLDTISEVVMDWMVTLKIEN